jgi:hypothetical protein
MAKAEPKWDEAGAVRRGESGDRLLDKHGAELASRIEDPGLSARLKADLATLKGTSRGAVLGTQKTATATEREIAEDAYDLLMLIRAAVQRSPNGTKKLRKAIGVGDDLAATKTQDVLDALNAVAANAAGLRLCRIAADDIEEAASLATQLQAADAGQTSAKQARAGSTEDRVDTQLRIEEAVDAIHVAGMLAFRKQPAIRARFERLVSASGPSAEDEDEGGGGGGGGPAPAA